MKTINARWLALIAITLFTFVAPSHAVTDVARKASARGVGLMDAGGIVLPAKAEHKGFSLARMAATTAAFNVTDRSGTVVPRPVVVSGAPWFQGLFTKPTDPTNTYIVSPGTWLYVPVVGNDDSPPIVGHFPDVRHRDAMVSYFYSHKEYGAVYTNITVDGKVTPLNEDYLVGVKVPNLYPTTYPGITYQYMTVAAFLTPLSEGTHSVEISGFFSGIELCKLTTCPVKWSVLYTVIVH